MQQGVGMMEEAHDALEARQREEEFAAALRAEGLRMTHQRLEVIRELASAKHHPNADDLFQAVRKRVPTISRDTVYRTVDTLIARGLVERVAAPGAARFDPDVSEHDHFICTRCGRIIDVGGVISDRSALLRGLDEIAEVTSVRLQAKGLCASCADALRKTGSVGTDGKESGEL